MRTWSAGPLALAVLAALSLTGGLPAQVINADFDVDDGGVSLSGSAVIQDDGCGNQVLLLTQNVGGQAGYGWFPTTFDLNTNRVEIEFDVLIGASDTVADPNNADNGCTPADGVSVIFQFDEDLFATGDAGGGMGVGNFRDPSGANPSDYVAVGLDIWDNGGVDVETACDGRYGGPSTCHVEVNQNIDPENVASQATNADLGEDCPDYIASAALYGTPELAVGTCGFVWGPQSCEEEDLIHVSIIFDNRLMLVKMEGGIAGDGVSDYPETTVINYATAPFPEGKISNIGFAASTGGRWAWQWVDNIVVRESDSAVTIEPEAPLTAGAITCGGPADVDASAEIGVSFDADREYGAEVSRTGDIVTGLTITTARFGRITANNVTNNIRPIDVSQIPGAGATTAEIFAYNRWDNGPIQYLAEVEPGQYDVTLYFAEDFSGAVTGLGYGTKVIDVEISGEKALCNWSAAAAAGSSTGSGAPNQDCTAVLDTGIARTFSVSVADAGEGFGVLDIQVLDLGSGNPPENATVNAVAFNRTGAASGNPISGDVECLSLTEPQDPAGLLIEEDFEDADIGLCPPGMVCNDSSGAYVPQVAEDLATTELRLRVAEDLVGNIGTTAIFEQTVNIAEYTFQAEFDIYMAWGDDQAPADGGSFFVLQGNNTSAVGAAGGAMAIPGGSGFTVEFDTWSGGGNNEPSGYNVAEAWTHVGINDMSTNSIITNVQFDPDLKPVTFGGTGWPDFRQPIGVHVEVLYDAGDIEVYLSGVEEDGVTDFPRTLVAATSVFPLSQPESVVGFSGATGGANQTIEYDNVEITAEPGSEGPESAAIELARQRWDEQGELYINCGGPLYACANQFPAPGATDDADKGEQVVWLQDQGGGSAPWVGEFFTVTPLNSVGGAANTLNTAGTNMGAWEAKGTDPGVDANDRLFWSERYADCQYDIPVPNGEHEVTLYFANSYSGTAGTALRFFHVIVEGEMKDGFEHCEFSGNPGGFGNPVPNPVFGFDTLFDPVDAAEQKFGGAEACNFPTCANPGVTVTDDPDTDQIPANEECGNAAPAALRYTVTVTDGALTIAITDPDPALGEPASPDGNPKISAIAVKTGEVIVDGFLVRGDADAQGGAPNITDGIYVLNFLFLGGPPPPCEDSADGDDSGVVNITDGIYILNFLFLGGPPPPAPFPDCGADTTPSALTCISFPPCG